MTYQQLDHIADLYSPLFGLAILIMAIALLVKKQESSRWVILFIVRSVLAVALCQQLAHVIKKIGHLGPNFPSTHFAVALALTVCMIILNRRLWPVAAGFTVAYGALMLFQHYHTPVEMLGALYAIPLTLLFHWKGNRGAAIASN